MSVIRTVCAHDCPDMCSLLAHVEDGRLVRIEGDPDQPFTAGFACAKVNREPELVHSPERVLTPLRRVGAKGDGRFAPVSWDAALDEIVARWTGIVRSDGPLAILGYCYSAHQGQLNRWVPMALFHALGTTRLLPGTVCDTCADVAWDMTLGGVGGADPEAVVDGDLVVAWSADLVTTNVHFWAKVEEARGRGATLIVVDPRRSRTAAQADWHLAPRVGTDAALALGVMHVLAREGLADRDYLARATLGWDRLERDVLPRFTPARVAEITGLAVTDIERFAMTYGRARHSLIRLGTGMSRHRQGGQSIRAVALLPGVTGMYGHRGAGTVFVSAAGMGFDYSAIRTPSGPAETRVVNHSKLGEALLELRDPPIKALFVASNNPAVTCPDSGRVRRGLAREDLFTVVHDPFVSDTARYADLVLPAALYLETEDIYRSYGAYYVQFGPRALPAAGEAWSNVRLAQELARRLGVTDPLFTASTDALVGMLFRNATGPAAAIDVTTIREAGPIKLDPYPDGQRFGTPSGKLEFYSERLAREGLPAMPDWWDERDGERWPLRLLTAPGYFQSHTVFSGNAALRRREGEPVCVLHPDEARVRGLADGDAVELVNDLGRVRMRLSVGDDVGPGVALVPGQRPAAEAIEGTLNALCDDRLSDLGAGATYQSTRLDVRRVGPSLLAP
ncbi:MAG: molybdopterin-dependent oxidoreductase [Candidatus Rokubacteria bacterium]|nr:molybdopterin-dependent oxidoreductase [Candidatus Rokubacteria bacterium]